MAFQRLYTYPLFCHLEVIWSVGIMCFFFGKEALTLWEYFLLDFHTNSFFGWVSNGMTVSHFLQMAKPPFRVDIGCYLHLSWWFSRSNYFRKEHPKPQTNTSSHMVFNIPWKSKTKRRMVFRMIHVKNSLLPMSKVWSLDFVGMNLKIMWHPTKIFIHIYI